MKPIRTLLVANRGEIACRIFRTCRRLGIRTVAVYSEADRRALHVREADTAIAIGPAESNQSYLSIEKLLAAAQESGADAVHPGYGFLSENSAFAAALGQARVIFVGPAPKVIDQMGDKIEAKALAESLKVPLIPGLTFPSGNATAGEIKKFTKKFGYPVITKAAAGGGGRGMRRIGDESEIEGALESAAREALSFFGSGALFIEKLVEHARHIEVQLLGDQHGNVVTIFDRDCTLQRNHQKVIEEAPAPNLPEKTRKQLHADAEALAKKAGYYGAGTVEFLLDEDGAYYFLEVNSRLQVEHPVTEAIADLDLVELQLRIAQGEDLRQTFDELRRRTAQRAAIELRLCAEIPERGFIASTGTIADWEIPERIVNGELRVDAGFGQKSTVSHYYDSLLAKLIVSADSREQAIAAALEALDNTVVSGVRTNAGFLASLLRAQEFKSLRHHTRFIDEFLARPEATDTKLLAAAALLVFELEVRQRCGNSPWDLISFWNNSGEMAVSDQLLRINGEELAIQVRRASGGYLVTAGTAQITVVSEGWDEGWLGLQIDSTPDRVTVRSADGKDWLVSRLGTFEIAKLPKVLKRAGDAAAQHSNEIASPLPGKIISIQVSQGDSVGAGDAVIVIESMKMEHVIRAPLPGTVMEIMVGDGDVVEANSILARLEYH